MQDKLKTTRKMPQPAFEVQKYLSQPLPHLREQYPPGTGGTGPRASWEGSLKGVEVIEDLDQKVKKCMSHPALLRLTNPYFAFQGEVGLLRNRWQRQRSDNPDFQSESVPKEAIQPHPKHKYPNIVQVHSKLPPVIKSPTDLQTCA